jgi:hypothetical protein
VSACFALSGTDALQTGRKTWSGGKLECHDAKQSGGGVGGRSYTVFSAKLKWL